MGWAARANTGGQAKRAKALIEARRKHTADAKREAELKPFRAAALAAVVLERFGLRHGVGGVVPLEGDRPLTKRKNTRRANGTTVDRESRGADPATNR